MRAVIQRVSSAFVTISGQVKSSIGSGYLILLGVCEEDTAADIDWLVHKIVGLRVFDDEQHVMNRSIMDVLGEVLVVSQFTLYANLHKGNRPSFDGAGKPEHAERMYELFMQELRNLGFNVQHGIFGAHMHVCYENDGPVTIIADSDDLFGLK